MERGKECQEPGNRQLRDALACMVMDLQREEEQQSALQKALAEAHEAERIASDAAEKSRMGEQRAILELERMVEAQLTLTSQLDDYKRHLEVEHQDSRRLRSVLSVAQVEREKEKSLRVECDTKLQHDLSTALLQQQELLGQLTEVDMQLAASKKASSAQSAVVIQQTVVIEQLKNDLVSAKAELHHAEDQLARHTNVTHVSRACSTADIGIHHTAEQNGIMVQVHSASREFHISDARNMLEQVHNHLNTARQENAAANRSKNDMWERIVQLEGKNAALLDFVSRLKQAISLTDLLANNKVVTSSGQFHANIAYGSPNNQPAKQQHSKDLHYARNQNGSINAVQYGQSMAADRPVFHWSGIDVCQVARQRDDALKDAMALSAKLMCAQRELLLTKSRLQMTRAAEESAVQASSHVSELSVRCTRLMCVMEGAASEMQLLSAHICHELAMVSPKCCITCRPAIMADGLACQDNHECDSCDTLHRGVKSIQQLSAALSSDLEGMKVAVVSLPRDAQLTEGIGSQERKRLCEQVAAQATDLQHAANASSRARAAAHAVLERVLLRAPSTALWLRASFSAWRGVAERQALVTCAQRAQDLEDWAAQARDVNCDRVSAWVGRHTVRKQAQSLRSLLYAWKYAAGNKKGARTRWNVLLNLAVLHMCGHQKSSRTMSVARRRVLSGVLACRTKSADLAAADLAAADLALYQLRALQTRSLISDAAMKLRVVYIRLACLGSDPQLYQEEDSCGKPSPVVHEPQDVAQSHKVDVTCSADHTVDGENGTAAGKPHQPGSCTGAGAAVCAARVGEQVASLGDTYACSIPRDVYQDRVDNNVDKHADLNVHPEYPEAVLPAPSGNSANESDAQGKQDDSESKPKAKLSMPTPPGESSASDYRGTPKNAPLAQSQTMMTTDISAVDSTSSPAHMIGVSKETLILKLHATSTSSRSTYKQQHMSRPRQQKPGTRRHPQSTAPPWRPSGGVLRPGLIASFGLPHSAEGKDATRKISPLKDRELDSETIASALNHFTTTTPQHLRHMSEILNTGAFRSSKVRSQACARKARSSSPISVLKAHYPCGRLYQEEVVNVTMPVPVRSKSVPCSLTRSHSPTADVCGPAPSIAFVCLTQKQPAAAPAWIRPASLGEKTACGGTDSCAVSGSRALLKKRWDVSDFSAAARLGFNLRGAVSDHIAQTRCSPTSSYQPKDSKASQLPPCQIRKTGNVTDCGMSKGKKSFMPSAAHRGKNMAKLHVCETKHVCKTSSGCTSIGPSPKKWNKALPMTLSRRAAHVRHVFRDKQAVAPRTMGEESHVCRLDKADLSCLENDEIQNGQAKNEKHLIFVTFGQSHDGKTMLRSPTDIRNATYHASQAARDACRSSLQQTTPSKGLLDVTPEAKSLVRCPKAKKIGMTGGEKFSKRSGNDSERGEPDTKKPATRPHDGLIRSPMTCRTPNNATVCSLMTSPSHVMLASAAATIDEAHRQVLTVSDMRHRVVQGSVPGLTKVTPDTLSEKVPVIAFQAGDLLCPRSSAFRRSASPTIASQLKQDIPYKVRLNAAARDRVLDPTGHPVSPGAELMPLAPTTPRKFNGCAE